jgi:hypothetical protein
MTQRKKKGAESDVGEVAQSFSKQERERCLAELRELGRAVEANPESRECLKRVLRSYRTMHKGDPTVYVFTLFDWLAEVDEGLPAGSTQEVLASLVRGLPCNKPRK